MLQPLSTIELQRYDWLDRASADPDLPDIARKLAQRIGSAYACERGDYAVIEPGAAAADLEVSQSVINFALTALRARNYLAPLDHGAGRRDRSTYRLNFAGDNRDNANVPKQNAMAACERRLK